MPTLPGAHLVLVHAHLALASFEARFNAGARLDHACQLRLGHTRRTQVVMIAVALILIDGIPRGTGLQRAVIRQGPPGDYQPLLGSRAFAFQARLNTACDHLDGHWPFFTVSHRQACPRLRLEALAPLRHRLPRGLGGTATPLIHGPWSLQVAHGGVARDPQHIPLATLAQLVAKPRVAAQLIIARDPAVGYLLPPR